MKENISLSAQWEMKKGWGRELYTLYIYCKPSERNAKAW